MSEEFVFQIEESLTVGQTRVRVEGRCCAGRVQIGDTFNELLIRVQGQHGAMKVSETQAVDFRVEQVRSIRPGVLGIGETGTLVLEIRTGGALLRDALLKGKRQLMGTE